MLVQTSPKRRSGARAVGATGARRRRGDAAFRHRATCVIMVPAAFVGSTVDRLTPLLVGRRDTRRQLVVPRRHLRSDHARNHGIHYLPSDQRRNPGLDAATLGSVADAGAAIAWLDLNTLARRRGRRAMPDHGEPAGPSGVAALRSIGPARQEVHNASSPDYGGLRRASTCSPRRFAASTPADAETAHSPTPSSTIRLRLAAIAECGEGAA